MRGHEFLDKMELIAPVYVEAADKKPVRRKRGWEKWTAAACLCLFIAAAPFLMNAVGNLRDGADIADTPGDDACCDGPPSFEVGEITYVDSGYGDAVTKELPEGFVEAGTVSFPGGYQNCPYYLNPDVPEWAYVYLIVHTDGTVDETGTLVNTPPHYAYARFVDSRLRGRALVCLEGTYYISMLSADPPEDVSWDFYDSYWRPYKGRVEETVPDGYVLAGTAEFSGHDTIPEGKLASNKEAAEVYYNPDDPDIIFVETHWFSAPEEEGGGEVEHDAFDVYLRYDCPFRDSD